MLLMLLLDCILAEKIISLSPSYSVYKLLTTGLFLYIYILNHNSLTHFIFCSINLSRKTKLY